MSTYKQESSYLHKMFYLEPVPNDAEKLVRNYFPQLSLGFE
jgi:hypothetical protein